MSAWYVLSTLGFYPVVPASGEFVLGAPLVRSARLKLPDGKQLKITADGFDELKPYASQARLNGQAVDPLALRYSMLMAGGQLQFTMAPLPK